MTRFAVVDLSNLFIRARHVTMGDPETKASMAIHICFKALRKLYRDFKVEHIVFAADHGSWRYDVYPLYKARRNAGWQSLTPDEREEMDIFHKAQAELTEFLREKTRCTVLEEQNTEGDDLIARWTQLHPADEHIIVSGDSDFVQLLGSNVSIYDGVNDRLIRTTEITNAKGEVIPFTVDTGSGRIKIEKSTAPFTAEAEWWLKALFVKIVRGDSGDGIFSAYPGITFKGTSKRTGIIQAWEDRHERGFHWNNFFQSEWQKATGMDAQGNPIFKTVKVLDEFRINEGLIDLTRQPDAIKQRLDDAIATALAKPPVKDVGLHFLKFCGAHNLPDLAGEARDHAAYLNQPYPLDSL